jgi:hypothetical protein
MGLRVSESVKIGPFRFRISVPLNGRGRTRVGVGTRTGRRGWTSLSAPLGGRKRRR